MSRAMGYVLCFLSLKHLLVPALASADQDAVHRLDEQVAAYKAAGEPIEPRDFESTGSISETENAAIELRKSGAAVDSNVLNFDAFEALPAKIPFSESDAATIDAMVAAHVKAIEHLDAAMTRREVDWQVEMKSPVLDIQMKYLGQLSNLAKLLHRRALLAHQRQDEAGTIADVNRLVFLSRAIDRNPFLISNLVSLGAMVAAADVSQQIAPTLRIGAGESAVTAQQVAQLIGALLDDAPAKEGQRRALLCERMFALDSVRSVMDGMLDISQWTKDPPPGMTEAELRAQLLASPHEDALLMMRHVTDVIAAVDAARNWPTLKRTFPARPDGMTPPQHWLAAILLPRLQRSQEVHFRAMTDRRLAAIALAARSHATEHNGGLPDTLSDLVPQYLFAVPLDPMAEGRTLNYRATMIYSVGLDGTDDGGDAKTANTNPAQDRWKARDVVVYLLPSS